MGKVIQHPDIDTALIRRETTHVAGVIEREMKQLQKKFPDHRFELEFEFQRLGKQKFYKIKIRTYNDKAEEPIQRTPTQLLLDWICTQGLDLSQYEKVLPDRIDSFFEVSLKPVDASIPEIEIITRLVNDIVSWENGNQSSSLEKLIDTKYKIISCP